METGGDALLTTLPTLDLPKAERNTGKESLTGFGQIDPRPSPYMQAGNLANGLFRKRSNLR